MEYLLTFFEGILSFVSPCMLPMLPLYVSYFSAGKDEKKHALSLSLSFVVGFSVMFCLLGVFAGTLGAALTRHRTLVNVVCGLVVIVFGLSYLNVIPLNFLKGIQGEHEIGSVFSTFLFGIVYSLSFTPCVGAFLGSALMLAASVGGTMKGLLLLLVYSLGLGIPFVLSEFLLEKLSSVFTWIKKHYKIINTICGAFLILVGIAFLFGWLNRFVGCIFVR